jgi:GH24 family phage-related lysozyme (muramidase)
MVILKSVITEALTSHKKDQIKQSWKEHPFLTRKGIDLIKSYYPARTHIGMGRYAAYKDYGEDIWRIGYGSKKLGKRWLKANDIATEEEIDTQLVEDLKIFSDLVSQYVFVPLNRNRKAAILSFSYSIGISSLKTCRLLELINSHASKSQIIREWSPYINRLWWSGGDLLVDQRRMELDTYLAPDKTIPTFVPHRCHLKKCLLNLPETYTGAPNQVKAIEYLEKKLVQWDSSGEVLRRFFRYWSEKPRSLGSPQRRKGPV